jgi:hypothetical protein
MSKRFVDTGLFDDDWFMDLSKDGKLLWVYFITKCDHAGMIKINNKLCKLQTGITDLEKTIKELSKSLVTVEQDLFFIPKYISFQYPGFPNSKVKQQESALNILENFELYKDGKITVSKELSNSYVNDSVNVIVNDSVIVKGGGKKFVAPNIEEVIEYFKENGFSEDLAKKAFNHYELGHWKDTNGKQVLNWKQKININWFKEENKESKKDTKKDRNYWEYLP